ncbi:nucleotidyltransferase domain-containing protein [Thermoanaerobacter uzonensis]|jgi:predicted nucleotidyltransferase|uniref:nucleotidyltransferase domain-containing protein n=1 Tax=Thermoanaerobacter uzonensis TaxID=447593 RepID=UPI003D7669A4
MPYIMPQKEKRLKVLRDELEKAIYSIISLNPEKVVLFGSLEREDVHLRSDIDLLIIWKTDLPFLERLQVFYDAIKPNVAMDILVYTPEEIEKLYRKNKFIAKVLDEGRVLYEKKQ